MDGMLLQNSPSLLNFAWEKNLTSWMGDTPREHQEKQYKNNFSESLSTLELLSGSQRSCESPILTHLCPINHEPHYDSEYMSLKNA